MPPVGDIHDVLPPTMTPHILACCRVKNQMAHRCPFPHMQDAEAPSHEIMNEPWPQAFASLLIRAAAAEGANVMGVQAAGTPQSVLSILALDCVARFVTAAMLSGSKVNGSKWSTHSR